MDIYDRWREIKRKHHLEKHTGESLRDAQGDLSCERCYGKNQDNQWKDEEVPKEFKDFWKIINKVVIEGLEFNGYNWVTIDNFYHLLDKEISEEQRDKILRRMIWSLTYDRKPKYTFGGIKTVIETIIKNCVEVKEDESIIFRDEEIMKRRLLGNNELIRYGYILDERERGERFQRFLEWYKNIIEENSGSIIIEEKYNTRRLFVELICLEEEIVKPGYKKKIEDFQKSFKYSELIRIRYERPW
jgi:hypothetical protein